MSEYDVEIDGGNGFYAISGVSRDGQEFIDENVQDAQNGIAHCDNSGYTQDIAEGALESGLSVAINGWAYLGNGIIDKGAPA